MPHSHHSHSGQFCKHAVGTLEEVVLEAIRQGFEVYGLTEHVPRHRLEDFYPEEEGLTVADLANQFDAFLDEAHRLKALYASQIVLLIGLETEYIADADLDHLEALLKKHGDRVEFVVGSVHHVNSIPIDFDVETFHKSLHSLRSGAETEQDAREAFLIAYFDAQYRLMERIHPEVIGHVDLCRLYDPELRIADFPRAWLKLERNVTYAIKYGALFEVNAAAFRKNWNTAYPATDALSLILHHGGRFALSDDSHGPHAVGLNYSRMKDYLRASGVSEIWYLQRSDTGNASGRKVRPTKLPGEWWTRQFWETS